MSVVRKVLIDKCVMNVEGCVYTRIYICLNVWVTLIDTTITPFVIAAAKKSSILDPPAHNRESLLGPPSVTLALPLLRAKL